MRPWRLLVAFALSAATIGVWSSASGAVAPYAGPTPDTKCDAGSLPEKVQGRAPLADVSTGRYARGYRCNAVEMSHSGSTGGYRVERYVDAAGHECAFYDSTFLFPTNVPDQTSGGPGVYVMDMHDPANPVLTDTLVTPAMLSPHESLRLSTRRGLLAAVQASAVTDAGVVDIYDVSKNCLHPTLDSSTPMGIVGHESGFAPDGNTFWVSSLYSHTLAAVDVSNPILPKIIFFSYLYQPHGVSLSDDGKTLFMAEVGNGSADFHGLTILDVSQVQNRALDPQVKTLARLTWPSMSVPQNATPFTEGGHHYLLESDEFGSGAYIGAARIIDVQNLRRPFVVSNMRLAVNQAAMQGDSLEADPGNNQLYQGYQGHYCSLPSRVDPQIVACSFIMSGLRVFDISDVAHPKEIAYFNKPTVPGSVVNDPLRAGSFAMSAPAYDEATGDIWYTDTNNGFYVVRLTGLARRAQFAPVIRNPGN